MEMMHGARLSKGKATLACCRPADKDILTNHKGVKLSPQPWGSRPCLLVLSLSLSLLIWRLMISDTLMTIYYTRTNHTTQYSPLFYLTDFIAIDQYTVSVAQ